MFFHFKYDTIQIEMKGVMLYAKHAKKL